MRAALCLLLVCWAGTACHAESSRLCEQRSELSAAAKDKLLRFGAVIKTELDASGQRLALVSRSGLDLQRFGVRYSHAGISLKNSANTPWSVRQLYYACDERAPRLFDEGMSAFVFGTDKAALGFVSVVLLPAGDDALALERAALDNTQALRLLGHRYSANAYPFSEHYQNCNQWLVEMLAAAWSRVAAEPDARASPRAQAQYWLRAQGYEPAVFDVGSRLLMWFGAFVPWLHSDDHPAADIQADRYLVSMPSAIEAFVRVNVPGATRLEFCHTEHQVVVHRGWDALPDDCRAGASDEVLALD